MKDLDLEVRGGGFFGLGGGGEVGILGLGKKEKHNLQFRPQLGLNITLGEGVGGPSLPY